tara:strand:- start:8787 stop:9065 length:279 start_codon:yes stop_codon:yes gene_type:complete
MKNYLIGLFAILTIIIIYLIIYGGEKNFFTLYKLKKEVSENKEILQNYEKEKKELKTSIEKLETGDLEYIEQIARDKLNMSEPDEIIIFNKE